MVDLSRDGRAARQPQLTCPVIPFEDLHAQLPPVPAEDAILPGTLRVAGDVRAPSLRIRRNLVRSRASIGSRMWDGRNHFDRGEIHSWGVSERVRCEKAPAAPFGRVLTALRVGLTAQRCGRRLWTTPEISALARPKALGRNGRRETPPSHDRVSRLPRRNGPDHASVVLKCPPGAPRKLSVGGRRQGASGRVWRTRETSPRSTASSSAFTERLGTSSSPVVGPSPLLG